jgi:hypothetical protein
MRPHAFILLFALAVTAVARGEAQPSAAIPADAADDLAGRFLTWLTADAALPPDALADGAVHVPLDKSTKSDAAHLAAHFAGGRVIATAVYTGRPTTLASDVSQQVQAGEGVPADKLAPLIVQPTRTTRANQVAADFVADLLACGENDTVGVAVVWYPDVKRHSLLNGATPEMKLALVAFVAPAVKEGQPPKITRVALGDVPAAK